MTECGIQFTDRTETPPNKPNSKAEQLSHLTINMERQTHALPSTQIEAAQEKIKEKAQEAAAVQ